MRNLDSILNSVIWSTNVHLVKAMAFPIIRYGCESWTIKKAECTLESALDSKEIQPVHPKGNQS